MRACLSVLLALASSFASSCAEGYPLPGESESAALIPTTGGMGGGGAGGAPGEGGMGGDSASGGMGGTPEPAGDPCTQNDTRPCPCEGSDAMGQNICMFDAASPTNGSFSGDCRGCPAPEPMATCSDGTQNGEETGVDCGGTECMPCAMSTGGSGGDSASGGSGGDSASGGSGGSSGSGGSGGMSATGGSGGASGSGGSSGSGGGEPTGPVEDCDGHPAGTECDRDCILPGNVARCTRLGLCSCL